MAESMLKDFALDVSLSILHLLAKEITLFMQRLIEMAMPWLGFSFRDGGKIDELDEFHLYRQILVRHGLNL